MERVITYIDGFNLYFGLKSKGWRRFFWLDVHLLSQNLLQPNQTLAAVKYFTSRVAASPRDPGKNQRQSAYLDALETLPLTSCFYGHYLGKSIQCHKCGHIRQSYEEKMTDVNIAVEMLTDAHCNAFDVALLISGDSDLTMPVERIRRLFPEKKVVVVFPPNRQSKRLPAAASAHFTLGRGVVSNSQLPDPVVKPDGFSIQKPPYWN